MSGGCFFGNGMTVAYFHSLGSTPSLSELLKIAVNGAQEGAKCLSMPMAEFCPVQGFC